MNFENDHRSETRCSGCLNIRLNNIPTDPRAVFVENVCAVLIDSRFGPGRRHVRAYQLSDMPGRERAAIYDLTPEGPVPSYTVIPDSEAARRYMTAAFEREIADARSTAIAERVGRRLAANMGRGSPPEAVRRIGANEPPPGENDLQGLLKALDIGGWPSSPQPPMRRIDPQLTFMPSPSMS
ncbi:hypothetical protein BH10ACI2_BH10ACI2_25430 [soil metagenome]